MDHGHGARRPGTGAASARSLLLTLLGEFVLPRHEPAWTAALVAALGQVGIEEKAARQALSRTAAEGLLGAERDGRRVRWGLTAEGNRLLAEGTERIYGFGQQPTAWDGRWLVLAVSVPESQRQLRHRLRTRLTWAGLGSPLPGLWVSPDVHKAKEVVAVTADLGVGAFCFIGPLGPIGDQQQVVRDAWSLTEVEGRYGKFLTIWAADSVRSEHDAFGAQVMLVQHWRRFPFLDPALPAELLPGSWPGPAAAELFRLRHDSWHVRAQAHWDRLCADAAVRS